MARTRKYYLKQLFDLEVKDQGPTKVITVCDTPPYGHAPTHKIHTIQKQLIDLEVKGQGPTKVITVRDTTPYCHAPKYQMSLTYLERQKCFGSDKNILFKKKLFDLKVKCQGPTDVITVRDTPPYDHAPTYKILLTYLERQKCYGPEKKQTKESAHIGYDGFRFLHKYLGEGRGV